MAIVGQELWILLKASMEDIINQIHTNMKLILMWPIGSKTVYTSCIYNPTDSCWDVVALGQVV